MGKVLVTHPGKYGDLLWALPTVRAISEKLGTPVDLAIPDSYEPIGRLIVAQPYINAVMGVSKEIWPVQNTAPVTPRAPAYTSEELRDAGYGPVFHLGYPAWPDNTLARYTHDLVQTELELNPHDLDRPWIEAPSAEDVNDPLTEGGELPGFGEVAVGFTDEWGELKLGILHSVANQHFGGGYSAVDFEVLCPKVSRWATEFVPDVSENVHLQVGDWRWAAYVMAHTKVFLGCLSSLAVLAKAMGKPRVLVEPNPQRHHMIFQHPDQGLVLGGDGQPTFDARHVAQALEAALRRV